MALIELTGTMPATKFLVKQEVNPQDDGTYHYVVPWEYREGPLREVHTYFVAVPANDVGNWKQALESVIKAINDGLDDGEVSFGYYVEEILP